MAISFVQALGSNQSKTAAASLAITVGPKTITSGNTMFLAYAGDNGGSAFGVTDNLGNTWTQVKEQIQTTGGVKTQLWKAPVTVGGSLTTITISWTTNVTAKAMVAGEFSGVNNTEVTTDGTSGTLGSTSCISSKTYGLGDLLIGAFGVEDDVAVSAAGSTEAGTISSVGSNGTSGGGSASNISCTLGYCIASNNIISSTNGNLNGSNSGSQNNAGAGAIYHPTAPPLFDSMYQYNGMLGFRQISQILVQ